MLQLHGTKRWSLARNDHVEAPLTRHTMGQPLDRKGPIIAGGVWPLNGVKGNVLDRGRVTEPCDLGVRAVNAMLTAGVGQRIAIVAAGPIANFLLAILFFWIIAMLGVQTIPARPKYLTVDGQPWKLSPLKPGAPCPVPPTVANRAAQAEAGRLVVAGVVLLSLPGKKSP